MDGPGWAAEPSAGPDDGADDGAGEPRWPWPLEKGAVHLAEPRCGTPPASPQPTPTGLPTLLAYRPEASQATVHREAQEDAEPTCEYCGNPLRPFPFSEDTPLSEDQADRFCCERSRELYEFITKEKKKLEDASSLPRAVSSLPGAVSNQESFGSETELLLSKEQENRRQQKRQLARELADQSLKPSATEGSQQAGSISNELSLELTSPTSGTPEAVVIAAEPEPKPQPKEKPKPEPQPKEKPEPEPQPKEELELKPQPKEKPEPQPKEELEPKPQPKEELELKPQPKEKPEPQPKEELKPKPQPKEELEPKPQPKEELEPKPQPKEKPEPEPQPKEELKPKPQLKEKPEPEPQPKEELEPKPQPKEKPKPEPQPKEELKPKPQPKEKPEPEPQPKEELKPKPQPKEKPEPEPQPKEKLELKPQPKGKPQPEPQPKEKLKLEPQPEEKPELEPQPKGEPHLEKMPGPKEEPELELQPKEKPKLEPRPKEKPQLEPRLKEEPGLKKEPRPEEESQLEPRPKEKPGPEPKPQPEPKPKPKKEPKHKEPVSRGILRYDFSLLGKKVGKAKLVQKYYKNGKKFLTMLPDGTSQLFYPSGNLAIVIIRGRDQLICTVQEDELRTTKIRALFQSDGRSTCYYPNGDEWINMSIQGGQYLDQAGNRVRRWTWPDLSRGPHAPLSPIFISLNRHVGVRILAQDKIFVSFLAKGRQAKFNMGTKVQVSTGSQLPPPARLGEDELLLLAFRVRILQLFDRMRGCLNFPSSEQWNKMQPPMYLMTQAVKILELCMAADISDELRSSIQAIVNAQ